MPNKQLLIGVTHKKSVFPDWRSTAERLSVGYHQNCITIIGSNEYFDGTLKEGKNLKILS